MTYLTIFAIVSLVISLLIPIASAVLITTVILRKRDSYWTRHWSRLIATSLFFFVVFVPAFPVIFLGIFFYVFFAIAIKISEVFFHWPATILVGLATDNWEEFQYNRSRIQKGIFDGPERGIASNTNDANRDYERH